MYKKITNCSWLVFAMLLTSASQVVATEVSQAPVAMPITTDMALAMAAAAERAAREQGFAIVVSIVDNHGNLKYFSRMDGTSSGSIQVSQLKAATAAQFPLPTKMLAQRSAALPANPYGAIPGFLLLEGGLPVMDTQGAHIGGIGISGATPALDAQFAQAALEAIGGRP